MHEELAAAETANAALRATRKDRWYPNFHIAAPAGWINDPNGLSFFKGRYHAFFQHHPYSSVWGPMHWGHVSSVDLVKWKREPIALAPSIEADRDGVFSGSAVVAGDTLFAFYTGHCWNNGVNDDAGAEQVQCLAVSTDGLSFEKKGVVVEGPSLPHFRDPKVWQIGETWYMVFGACSEENRGEVWLYTSPDLQNWQFDRILFQDPDPNSFMLECPDFFPLGDYWVLIFCPMGPEKDGYANRNSHNAGYVVGQWEPGGDFKVLTDYRLLDWGANFYAPQTFLTQDGRRAVFGWMGSFGTPTVSHTEGDGWSGQLTVPREFTLTEGLKLRNFPVAELAQLRENTRDFGAFTLEANTSMVLANDARAFEIELEVDLAATDAERFGLELMKTAGGAHTFAGYDGLAQRVFVDRRLAGHGDRGYRSAPYPGGQVLSLRVLVDSSSVEVFINGGLESVTSFAFPNEGRRGVSLVSECGEIAVTSLRMHTLGGMWLDPSER